MATINFLYRSTRSEAKLNLRLLFRHEGKDFVYSAKTHLQVSKDYWDNDHTLKRVKDIEVMNKQTEVNNEINNITQFVLKEFDKLPMELINKQWLEIILNEYYNPKKEEKVSDEIIEYIEIFKEYKKNEIKANSLNRYNVVKQMLIRYQTSTGSILLIKHIDLDFKKDFEGYCLKEGYGKSTIARAIKSVKTLCHHAQRYKGIEVNKNLVNIKVKSVKTKIIFLDEEELNKLETLPEETLPKHLSNARDWLLISCYTGQRVGDFMRFATRMIKQHLNKKGELRHFIEFEQQKGEKKMNIPFPSKAMAILNKRNGNFPHRISDPKYNKYIKKVCQFAEIDEIVNGSKKVFFKEENGKKLYRKKEGKYPKFELVGSHIGRRSLASNKYGKMPTSLIMQITGHGSEKMLLAYIGKSSDDYRMDMMEYSD